MIACTGNRQDIHELNKFRGEFEPAIFQIEFGLLKHATPKFHRHTRSTETCPLATTVW